MSAPRLPQLPALVYIAWVDAVGKSHYSQPDSLPSAVTLRGYTNVVEENEEDVVVAHFLASDGGFMDTVAIPRRSILCLDLVAGVRRTGHRADAHEELKHGY